jgi:class 3 adenylate cyclase/predicted ATPase/ABC-type dipeptide/oligopeptide/nickel transport system ATPase component
MTFDDMLAQIIALLKRQGRVSYGALKRRYDLDDAYLADLKDEIIHAQRLAVDEDNRVLVWVGEQAAASVPPPVPESPVPTSAPALDQARAPLSYTPKHLAEKILTSRSALEGERKQVTVLFCDLANSTSIAERLDPEHMHILLNRFFELALSEVHQYEGTINQFLGDGFMALFGAPIAHEDHARRAILAALALQHTLKEADLGKPYGEACQFRMGLNSGLVVGSIGDNLRMDYSAIGDTTNLASRLQGVAEPGTILMSASTSRLVHGYVRLEASQPVQVKGKTEPVSIYKVVGTLPRRSPIVSRSERTLSPFVGRERELATLEALFAQIEVGQGQVVGIVAEAGGGKSRLLYEFRQRLQDKRVTYLEGHCLSYGSSIPYHPLLDVLRHNCGISETESPATIIEKVRLAVQEVGMDPEESAPYLLQLLGVKEGTESIAVLTPEVIRTRTFATLQQMSLKGSQQRPLIIEIEDLHWLDQTSEAYLSSLVESLTGASILLLTTYRPGYRPPWLEKSYATQVALPNLTPQHAVTVIHSTSQQKAVLHLEQVIIEKAQGNPFFLEELTRAVIEHEDTVASIDVPDTIQGVLSARIDRLPEAHKRLLQTASVLGRAFSPTLLRATWDGRETLEPLLRDLKHLEFLYEQTSAEGASYVFKHALTQEVTYDSLLTTRRQGLHAAAGHALERLYPDWLVERSEELARHYTEAGITEKAVHYWHHAGQKAIERSAHVEAIAHLRQGLMLLPTLPETPQRLQREVDMHIALGASLLAVTGYGAAEVGETYTRAQHLCEHLDNPQQLFPVLRGLWNYYHARAEYQTAHALGEQLLTLAQQVRDAAMLLAAHRALGSTLFYLGAVATAHTHVAQGIALYNPQQHRTSAFLHGEDSGVVCHIYAAWALWTLGYPEQGLARSQEAVNLAQQVAHPISLSFVLSFAAVFHQLCREGRAVQARAEAAISLTQEQGFPYWMAYSSMLRGWALAHQGRAKEGIEQLHQGLRAYRATGAEVGRSHFLALLAEAHGIIGEPEAGLTVLTEALTLVDKTGERWYESEIYRLKGELLLQRSSDNATEAETCLQHALDIARNQQAKSFELRAARSLSKLWHQQGKRQEAHDLLAPIYHWFTEGFDTADLQESKALLDELA